jgi:uncharacterized membrane protein YhaH (DUF805 family)
MLRFRQTLRISLRRVSDPESRTLFNSLTVTRLHDFDASGWWAFAIVVILAVLGESAKYHPNLFSYIAVAATIIKLVFFRMLLLITGTIGSNRYD